MMGKTGEAFLEERERQKEPLLELLTEEEWQEYQIQLKIKYGNATATLLLANND